MRQLKTVALDKLAELLNTYADARETRDDNLVKATENQFFGAIELYEAMFEGDKVYWRMSDRTIHIEQEGTDN